MICIYILHIHGWNNLIIWIIQERLFDDIVCNRGFAFIVLQETADEGQGGAEGDSRQSPKNIGSCVTYPPSSASATINQSQTLTCQGEVRIMKHSNGSVISK
jgi:hypothetical protein